MIWDEDRLYSGFIFHIPAMHEDSEVHTQVASAYIGIVSRPSHILRGTTMQ